MFQVLVIVWSKGREKIIFFKEKIILLYHTLRSVNDPLLISWFFFLLQNPQQMAMIQVYVDIERLLQENKLADWRKNSTKKTTSRVRADANWRNFSIYLKTQSRY